LFVGAAAAALNSLSDSLKDTALSLSYFHNHLKSFLFWLLSTNTSSALNNAALYKPTLLRCSHFITRATLC